MKKTILFLFVLMLLTTTAWAKSIFVVTTTADLKSLVEFIGGDKVRVYSLGKGNQNYHFLQAKPSFMIKAKKADLFIRNGLELEVGYEPLILEGSRNPNIQVGRGGHLDASKGIKALEVPDHFDRSMGDIHASGNPHYWLDPLNMKIVASNIFERLSEISSDDKSYFEANLRFFNNRIDQKMDEWTRELLPYKGELLVTHHKSWAYFAQRFDLKVIDELEPKPGISPSPTHLQEIINLVNKKGVKVILMENIYKAKAAKFVMDKTGANVVVTPISTGGDKESSDYIKLMDVIIQKVKEGFQKE